MADEPMSDERLAEIRARAEAIRDWLLTPESDNMPHFPTSRRLLGVDALALLAEVDRLRAREVAAMEIVRDVANATGWYDSDGPTVCMFCTKEDERYSKDWALEHMPDCPVTKARALLAGE